MGTPTQAKSIAKQPGRAEQSQLLARWLARHGSPTARRKVAVLLWVPRQFQEVTQGGRDFAGPQRQERWALHLATH